MKHDAELAHQNRLSRGTDVFTISSGGRGVSVYLTFFYASGPPVVKLDAILFGVSCRDNAQPAPQMAHSTPDQTADRISLNKLAPV